MLRMKFSRVLDMKNDNSSVVKVAVLCIIFFIYGCSNHSVVDGNVCGSDLKLERRDEIKITKIALSLNDDDLFYYYRNEYVIFLAKKDVFELLEKNSSYQNYNLLRKKISDEIPLDKYVDLRGYSFTARALDSASKHIAMTLIEAGKARVVDMRYGEKGQELTDFSMVYLSGGGEWRLACDSGYGLILEVNDSID